ncbi:hypothetical protein BamMC406_3272 [Burkholderia ambifaria MC40-6]|jgi:hypothetical protein|uniref:Uncharacterized protein n=1 Tax=Burkholderia ambifaria (strain MC40-6) TaxID=398577 RepID=B1YYD8_BURA4|nr:hypothetical protein [Burkholderia ambifaria]ACB65744.1 hypothetical protein BamMC406_3272 [Burkholderia ambifaria MC40-6]
MRNNNERVRGRAIQAIRLQYESDRQLLERRAQLEQRSENARRDHEWKIMLSEKGLLAVIVGLTLAVATVCGNILVERYKSDAAVQQTRASTIRQASNKVWRKFVVFEASVNRLGDAVQTRRFHKGIDMFRADLSKDQKDVDNAAGETRRTLSDLWNALREEELNLGPGMHAVFFRAMQDLAEIRSIYESEALHGDEQDKIDADAIGEARNDLQKRTQVLSSVLDQL